MARRKGRLKMTNPKTIGFILLVSVALTGCEAANGFNHRYGPDPAMPEPLVEASTIHQNNIMDRLRLAAHCPAGGRGSLGAAVP